MALPSSSSILIPSQALWDLSYHLVNFSFVFSDNSHWLVIRHYSILFTSSMFSLIPNMVLQFSSNLNIFCQSWCLTDWVAWWDVSVQKTLHLSLSNLFYEVNTCLVLTLYMVNQYFDGVLIFCCIRWTLVSKHGTPKFCYVDPECIFLGEFNIFQSCTP